MKIIIVWLIFITVMILWTSNSIYSICKTLQSIMEIIHYRDTYEENLENEVDLLKKENEQLKKNLTRFSCKNKYFVSNKNNDAVMCYTMYDCDNCSHKGVDDDSKLQ